MKKSFLVVLLLGLVLAVSAGFIQGEEEKLTAEKVVENMKTGNFCGEPMNFNFQEADLRTILELFEKISRLEIVLKPGVEGTVTFKADKIPWDKALLKFITDNNLKFKAEENKLVIWKEEKEN